ncbi:MAG: tyrosine--tRNA ligase [Actinomycetota bacterium]
MTPPIPPQEQAAKLRENVAQVIPDDELDSRLAEAARAGRPLRVKLGVDPTARHVTLGWTVVLRKLRQFQDLGHTAVLIIGDFTAQVGDPSGRSETRKPLTKEEVETYASAVLEQFRLVLHQDNLEVRRNSEWLASMGMPDVMRLVGRYTVARMLERDDFARRYAEGRPISVVEFLYPLMQGYDSIAVEADVELGGTDQTFNLLVGRDLQERFGQRRQIALTMPLLEGTDGVQKMSQSLGNYIGITEAPDEIFGKVMRVPDGLMTKYFQLTTGLAAFQVDQIAEGLSSGRLHPAEAKRRLGWELVKMYHGEEAAEEARERFDRVHRSQDLPEEIPEASVPESSVRAGRVYLPRLLSDLGLASSNSEGRRLIAQGGVRLDLEVVLEEEVGREELAGKVLQVGRRSFVRLR